MGVKIGVTINKQGESKIDVDGVVGTGCTDVTKFLERQLGTVSGEEKKSEYYQVPDIDQHVRTNQGR